MKELAPTLNHGSSALLILGRKATLDKVLDELKGSGGGNFRDIHTFSVLEEMAWIYCYMHE